MVLNEENLLQYIKNITEKEGIRQSELALLFSVGQATVSKMFSENRVPEKVAEALGFRKEVIYVSMENEITN